MSKKKIITETVEKISPYDFEGKLSDMACRVDVLIKKYGMNAVVDWDSTHQEQYTGNPSPTYFINRDREETDSELANRLRTEKENLARQEERDLDEFERLKKKLNRK